LTFEFTASGFATASQARKLLAKVERRSLTPQDPLWSRYKGLRPLDGDVLVSIQFDRPGSGASAQLYLVNRMGRRAGAVALGASS
jgi:hypothetical protein